MLDEKVFNFEHFYLFLFDNNIGKWNKKGWEALPYTNTLKLWNLERNFFCLLQKKFLRWLLIIIVPFTTTINIKSGRYFIQFKIKLWIEGKQYIGDSF